jgi:transcriptional regulatory protein RtcR
LEIDLFDRMQLTEVVRVCRLSRTLSEAGRKLFNVSRTRKGTPNDADRLRKYLSRFGLNWAAVHGMLRDTVDDVDPAALE